MCARPANPQLREEILKAATRIIEQCGPDCVTMREVAEEVGYTPTTLYLYFKDKDAILAEVIASSFEELADFCSLAEVGPTLVDRHRQRSRAYVVWGMTHPGLYALVFESRIEAMEATPEQRERSMKGPLDSWRVIREAIATGELVDVADPERFGVASWAAIHGVTSLAIARRLPGTPPDASAADLLAEATAMAATLVEALLAPHLSRSGASA